jgi:hypothetical protein
MTRTPTSGRKTPKVHLGVNVEATLRAALEAAAKDDGRNMSSMASKLLRDGLRASGHLKDAKP